MKKFVLGSLNIDRTYHVESFAQPKETIAAKDLKISCGGKGFNQAIALARAGSDVYFGGCIGNDGARFIDDLNREGIKNDLIKHSSEPSGHAIIQVNDQGQNCIITLSGSNGEITKEYIDMVIQNFEKGDVIVLQNEIPNIAYAIDKAYEHGLTVVFNPSPINSEISKCRLEHVHFLLINEIEGACITNETDPKKIVEKIHNRYSQISVLMTLGEDGSLFMSNEGEITKCRAIRCEAVDTTAAGDTFTGYFITEYMAKGDAEYALKLSSVASGLAVCREGAACSIPTLSETLLHYQKEFE